MSRCERDSSCMFFFFFNDTATTEIYTLSLHDALPILTAIRHRTTLDGSHGVRRPNSEFYLRPPAEAAALFGDRKSTRLNSSHGYISYAVFCLKKNKPFDKHDGQ